MHQVFTSVSCLGFWDFSFGLQQVSALLACGNDARLVPDLVYTKRKPGGGQKVTVGRRVRKSTPLHRLGAMRLCVRDALPDRLTSQGLAFMRLEQRASVVSRKKKRVFSLETAGKAFVCPAKQETVSDGGSSSIYNLVQPLLT